MERKAKKIIRIYEVYSHHKTIIFTFLDLFPYPPFVCKHPGNNPKDFLTRTLSIVR